MNEQVAATDFTGHNVIHLLAACDTINKELNLRFSVADFKVKYEVGNAGVMTEYDTLDAAVAAYNAIVPAEA